MRILEEQLLAGRRLEAADVEAILRCENVLLLSERAHAMRERLHPGAVVEHRLVREVLLSTADGPRPDRELDAEREQARLRGVDEVRLLPGPHPLTLGRLADLIEETRDRFGLVVGAFPAAGLPGPPGTLRMLRRCGLGGLLVSGEAGSDEAVRSSCEFGLPVAATLAFRSGADPELWIAALLRLRSQADRYPIMAFLPRQEGGGDAVGGGRGYSGFDFLRMVAIARLFFDNIPSVRAPFSDKEQKMAQVALRYGADHVDAFDPGPGGFGFAAAPRAELLRQIREAGFEPAPAGKEGGRSLQEAASPR